MKKKIILAMTSIIVITSAGLLVACNSNNNQTTNGSNSDTMLNEEIEITTAPNDSTDDEVPPVQTAENTIVDDDDSSNDSSGDQQSSSNSGLATDDAVAIFTDHLNTGEYVVEKTGTYEFECEPSDKNSYWDIYVLDEPFDDALRYLTSAYSPKLKATSDSKSIKLNKGQYVYCVCSQNAFTDSGNKNFSCPLTIEMED